MLKILEARLQQYLTCELSNVQAGFWKGRGTRNQIANILWIIKKARQFHLLLLYWICQSLWLCGSWTVNFQMFKRDLKHAEKPEIKLPTSFGSSKKQDSSTCFCFTEYAKAFDCVDHELWKILQGMGIPDHLTCLLRNQYASQEATVRTGHGAMDWFQIGKRFNLHAEYIILNAGLCEAQAGIKISGRNINNLRYADDTTLMAESKE